MLKHLSSLARPLAVLTLCLSIAPAETAWQALDVVRSQRGPGAVSSVTQVRGHRGQDQPAVWEIVTRVADSERVYVTGGGKITADTVYSAGGGVPIDMRRLRVDTTEIFKFANRAAAEAKVGFDSVDYELRAAQFGNAPLWVIFLRDVDGRDVGMMEISGEDRRLMKQQWFTTPQVADREPIGPQQRRRVVRSYGGESSIAPGASRSSEGIWSRAGTGVANSGVRIKNGVQTLGEGFGRLFSGNRGAAQPVRRNAPNREVPPTRTNR